MRSSYCDAPMRDDLHPQTRKTASLVVALVHLRWRRFLSATILKLFWGAIGRGTTIFKPLLAINSEYVQIGAHSLIRAGCRIEVALHGQPWRPRLSIGDNVNIEQHVHIICHDTIEIGDNVSITGHSAIVDVSHPIAALHRGQKIGDAIDPARSSVVIGRDSFIGFGTTILPNTRIGQRCVIGAGSVVSGTIPDDAIAAGVPAKVIGSTKNEQRK